MRFFSKRIFLFPVFVFYFEKGQDIILVTLVKMLIVIEKKLLIVIQCFKFLALLCLVDIGHKFTQVCGWFLQQQRDWFFYEVGVDIVGDEKFHEALDGNAVKRCQVVQGIDRGRYAACLIMGIGLPRYVQMGGDEFLMISVGFPEFFQILCKFVVICGIYGLNSFL